MRFYYIGKFNENGISEFLNEGKSGNIFDNSISSLQSEIKVLLPERQKLHHVHPEWLTDNSFDIVDNTEIKVSFVDEGAGYRNAIGYFIYNTKNPPATINHIKECYFIFPNFSKKGSGGDLKAGDTMQLAYEFENYGVDDNKVIYPKNYIFPAGKSVGFILFPNGWKGDGVTPYVTPFTSSFYHNPEKAEELKYHTACLQLSNNNKLVLSFEDINRESSSCDHDFNDAVMCIELDINAIGKGFTDTKGFSKNENEPDMPDDYTIGFKKIFSNIGGKIVEAVATLFIPKTSTIMRKKSYTSRQKTNHAYVKNIIVVTPKTNKASTTDYVSRKLETGFSWYNKDFLYRKGSFVEAEISEDTLTGIYFFYTFKDAADYSFDPMKI